MFNFEDSEISVIRDENSRERFHLGQVCRCLELSNPSVIAARYVNDEVSEYQVGVGRPALYVTEPGFYVLALTVSKSIKARKFQKFVFNEVLPSIRKSGAYISPDATDRQLEEIKEQVSLIQADRSNRLAARVGWTDVIKERLVAKGEYRLPNKKKRYAMMTAQINMHLFGQPNFAYDRDNMTPDQQNAIITFETLLTKIATENPEMDPEQLVSKTLLMI